MHMQQGRGADFGSQIFRYRFGLVPRDLRMGSRTSSCGQEHVAHLSNKRCTKLATPDLHEELIAMLNKRDFLLHSADRNGGQSDPIPRGQAIRDVFSHSVFNLFTVTCCFQDHAFVSLGQCSCMFVSRSSAS